jgi:cytoskeletal protein CcmA (bactofilin family)
MGEGALNIINPLDSRESVKLLNTIAENSIFEGSLKSDKSFGVDGTVVGHISTPATVMVSNGGLVRGEVECHMFELAGTCEGRARVDSRASLQAHSTLDGDISCGVLVVESGAKIQGRLRTQKYRG